MLSDDLTLSVVIPTKNRSFDIDRCLSAVEDQTQPPDEVIVIDNGSTDETPAVISRHPTVLGISDASASLPRLFNRGWKIAPSRLVGFLNDDAVPDRDWAEQARTWFRELPDAVAVGGPIRDRTDRLMRRALKRGSLLLKLYDVLVMQGRLREYYLLTDWGAYSIGDVPPPRATKVTTLSITNMVVRKEALEAAGGFDEDFQYAAYDGHFFRYLSTHGQAMYAVPTGGVDHFCSPIGNTRSAYYQSRDYAVWFSKFHPSGIKGRMLVRLGELSLLGFWLRQSFPSRFDFLKSSVRGFYAGLKYVHSKRGRE